MKQHISLLSAAWVAAGITAAAVAPAQADNIQDGIHGWDVPENAEFILKDVRTKFLFPKPEYWEERDVYIDCDLLVDDNGNKLATTGFMAQFNAENAYTMKQLSEQVLELLQNWKGQLDYTEGNVSGTVSHMSSQHGIGYDTIAEAGRRCVTEHSNHGTPIQMLTEGINNIKNLNAQEPQ